ncbi:hypothetical protein ACFT1A_26130 [Rhodococcus sp. NPDC057135]|uniref:amino acid kinase family protein n=1 Tax=Rhodococcus sp. NPDC057135 TaxID=3346028 RepID=UPI00362FE52B
MTDTANKARPVVIKLGGSCLANLAEEWWGDLADLAHDRPAVLVHGWSKQLRSHDPRHRSESAILRDRYGNQSRWTTDEVIHDIKTVSTEVAAGVRDRLGRRGVNVSRALGSDGLVHAGEAERWWWRGKELVELDNRVGPIERVDISPLRDVRPGHVYLVTPLARNTRGIEVNTDADRAAAAVAAAIGASDLILVTDVAHLLIDGRAVHHITRTAAANFRDKGATGGMRKKLRAATEALDQGVDRVTLGSATVSDLLHARTGTTIVANTEVNA